MNNFWYSIVDGSKVEHFAYDPSGQIIDHFIQYIDNYI